MKNNAEIFEIVEKFRAEILRKERESSVRMLREYGKVYLTLKAQLEKLTDQIRIAGEKGEEISPAWLFRQERFRTLLAEIAAEMKRFSRFANGEITKTQKEAIRTATKSAQAQLKGLGATWSRLPALEVEQQIGFLSDGSPLSKLLDQFGPDAREHASGLLIEAVALGYNPNKTAQKMRAALKGALIGGLTRATRISRTETMRAYREATTENFRANADILDGWIWIATLAQRTCPACLALHGTFHTLDERMTSHVNCRCTQAAAIAGESSPVPQKGAEWFADQTDRFQRDFFKDMPGAFEAYQSGELALEAFVGRRDNRTWGPSYQALTTAQARRGLSQFPGDADRREPVRPATKPFDVEIPAVESRELTAAEARARLAKMPATLNVEYDRLHKEYKTLGRQAMRAMDAGDKEAEDRYYQEQAQKLLEIQRFNADRAEKARAVLYRPTAASFSVMSKHKPETIKEWARGIEAFRRFVGAGWLDRETVRIKVSRKARAHYDMQQGSINVRLHNERPSTIVHELGHWLEDMDREIFQAISEFLARRTAGESPQPLRKWSKFYKKSERTRPDRFISPYMGAVYENEVTGARYASEILSMGLQYFYERPVEFASEDPEYFDFIYDLLRRR